MKQQRNVLRRRILSLLLTLVMVAGLVPTSFATGGTTPDVPVTPTLTEGDPVTVSFIDNNYGEGYALVFGSYPDNIGYLDMVSFSVTMTTEDMLNYGELTVKANGEKVGLTQDENNPLVYNGQFQANAAQMEITAEMVEEDRSVYAVCGGSFSYQYTLNLPNDRVYWCNSDGSYCTIGTQSLTVACGRASDTTHSGVVHGCNQTLYLRLDPYAIAHMVPVVYVNGNPTYATVADLSTTHMGLWSVTFWAAWNDVYTFDVRLMNKADYEVSYSQTIGVPANGVTVGTGAETRVPYGNAADFSVTVDAGYDAEKMVVTANGYEIKPTNIPVTMNGTVIYTYAPIINIDTDIKVTNVYPNVMSWGYVDTYSYNETTQQYDTYAGKKLDNAISIYPTVYANGVYTKDSTANEQTTMSAGQVYCLELPQVYDYINVLANNDQAETNGTALAANVDYVVTWQYRVGMDWRDYVNAGNEASIIVDAAQYPYSFRAIVEPASKITTATSRFNKAATYANGYIAPGVFETHLVTDETAQAQLHPVNVTLTVQDAIPEQNADIVDVFENNPITFTAKVTGQVDGNDADTSEDTPWNTSIPTGTVKFQYQNEDEGEDDWNDFAAGGVVNLETYDFNPVNTQYAPEYGLITFTTNELQTNDLRLAQTVKVRAVYYGNETYQNAESVADVYVRSTQVYVNPEVQNQIHELTKTDHESYRGSTAPIVDGDTAIAAKPVENNIGIKFGADRVVDSDSDAQAPYGIYIYDVWNKAAANESDVEIFLGDIYTNDFYGYPAYYQDDDVYNEYSRLVKLEPGVDYTITWQKLNNYAAWKGNLANAPWSNIPGLVDCDDVQIDAEQTAAYRAKINVNGGHPTNLPTVQYSDYGYTRAPGEYYSNIITVSNSLATVMVNVNTSETEPGMEGIVEGETVTIHTFLSGDGSSSGTVPTAEMDVAVYKTDANGNLVKADGTSATDTSDALCVFRSPGSQENTVNGHVATQWNTGDPNNYAEPGYYQIVVEGVANNGYDIKPVTKDVIIRDTYYGFTTTNDTVVYNGRAQGLKVNVTNMAPDFDELAQKTVVVYYYEMDAEGNWDQSKPVEPSHAGTYKAIVRLQESAFWTEDIYETTFTIQPRPVEVVDLVAQTKIYDGTTNINLQEIILNDAVTHQTGDGMVDGTYGFNGEYNSVSGTGVINGDSVYAVGMGVLGSPDAGANTYRAAGVTLEGGDADNYRLVGADYTTNYSEKINVLRNQVQGDIAANTYSLSDLAAGYTLPAEDIYLIDQSGTQLQPGEYDVTYYYHNGDGVEKVDNMSKYGLYTVIARPNQDNFKGGASTNASANEYVSIVADSGTTDKTDVPSKDFSSTLINITNTAVTYNGQPQGVDVTYNDPTTLLDSFKVEYQLYDASEKWTTTVPTNAGRYLVKVTAVTEHHTDVAYGIFTIHKALPTLTLNANSIIYDSAQYADARDTSHSDYCESASSGSARTESLIDGKYENVDMVDLTGGTYVITKPDAAYYADTTNVTPYFTYTGGTIQGVDYQSPTEVGRYAITAHLPETDNFASHEVTTNFDIKHKELTITANSWRRQQYEAYPDLTSMFSGLAVCGVAMDTSLRDVQIQPEMIYNGSDGYSNNADDQVGNEYNLMPASALARNYKIDYWGGNLSVTNNPEQEYIQIHGMPNYSDNAVAIEQDLQNGVIDTVNTPYIAYYGDEIQLYAYGSRCATSGILNDSSIWHWSLDTNGEKFAEINPTTGLLKINKATDNIGNGQQITVTVSRDRGNEEISASIEIMVYKQEVIVEMANQDRLYCGYVQYYNSVPSEAQNSMLEKLFAKTDNGFGCEDDPIDNIGVSNNGRTSIGSQVVTGKVADCVDHYQSETYGGLFTINDKDVYVIPNPQTTVYGTQETYNNGVAGYTEDYRVIHGEVSNVPAITGANWVSLTDAYANLDVYDGYEIFVSGKQNLNYNVMFLTDDTNDVGGDADDQNNITSGAEYRIGDSEVTLKDITTVYTGAIDQEKGMTSGSLNPLGKYNSTGWQAAKNALDQHTVRMFGEPNWVMTYKIENGLIAGDSLADLAPVDLQKWMVRYDHGIGEHANINWEHREVDETSHNLTYHVQDDEYDVDGTTKLNDLKTLRASDYIIETDGNASDDNNTLIAFDNYDVKAYSKGIQNIYQRPVTLDLRDEQTVLNAFSGSILDSSADGINDDMLYELLLENLIAGTYEGKGGLATLLNHEVKDLKLRITAELSSDGKTITAKIKIGNHDYWLSNDSTPGDGKIDETYPVEINVVDTIIYATYGTLYATHASVTLYQLDGERSIPYDAGSKTVEYLIYQEDLSLNGYTDYLAKGTQVRKVDMTKRVGATGVYDATFAELPAGRYTMFALVDGYVVVRNFVK